MSLQRVLETARKAGMPVIVTDPAGREPMVVMPLEQFEAMSEGQADPVEQTLADMTDRRRKAQNDEAATQIETMADQGAPNPEFPLEERFYLEPVEDKGEA